MSIYVQYMLHYIYFWSFFYSLFAVFLELGGFVQICFLCFFTAPSVNLLCTVWSSDRASVTNDLNQKKRVAHVRWHRKNPCSNTLMDHKVEETAEGFNFKRLFKRDWQSFCCVHIRFHVGSFFVFYKLSLVQYELKVHVFYVISRTRRWESFEKNGR